jgi:hypothetical protein
MKGFWILDFGLRNFRFMPIGLILIGCVKKGLYYLTTPGAQNAEKENAEEFSRII